MEALLKQAMNGKKEAVLELYEKYKEKVYFLCHSLIENEQDVDFVFQDIFKEMWKISPQKNLKSLDDFEELLMRTSVKYCLNHVFNGQPHIFKENKPEQYAKEEYISKEATIDAKEALNVLKTCGQPEAFLLTAYFISKLSYRSLAQVVNIEEINVESYFYDAYEKCRDQKFDEFESALSKYEINIPEPTNTGCIRYIEQITNEGSSKAKFIIPVVIVLALIAGFFGYRYMSADKQYVADIEVEDYGTITVELNSEVAPKTVENFVSLAKSGFYDGLTFHRIMDGFMIQGGDPNHDGTGGSDETIEGEFEENGHENSLSHVRGTISMARSSDYDSASSQFFIVQTDATYLDGEYAAFGTVTSGMDIVDKICEDVTPYDDNGSVYYEEQPVIKTITIRTE